MLLPHSAQLYTCAAPLESNLERGYYAFFIIVSPILSLSCGALSLVELLDRGTFSPWVLDGFISCGSLRLCWHGYGRSYVRLASGVHVSCGGLLQLGFGRAWILPITPIQNKPRSDYAKHAGIRPTGQRQLWVTGTPSYGRFILALVIIVVPMSMFLCCVIAVFLN